MYLWSVVYFFVVMYGLGHAATCFLKTDDFWERHLMRLGIGLGVFTVLGSAINFLGAPLNWLLFLLISLVSPVYSLVTAKAEGSESEGLHIKRPSLSVIFVLIFTLGLFIAFHQGAFAYPWLEDGDPWEYAEAAKYIAHQQTFNRELEKIPGKSPEEVFSSRNATLIREQVRGSYGIVMDPYPQGYQMLMGVLHQTNESVSWTLKFFNALTISLGVIFFYYFVKRLTNSNTKAVLAAFSLAVIPCYLGHFIFATPLAVTLFFPALYAVTRIEHERHWYLVAAIVIAAIVVTHILASYVFAGFLLFYIAAYSLSEKKVKKYVLLAGVLGLIIGLAVFWVPEGIKFGGLLNPFVTMFPGIYGGGTPLGSSGVGGDYSPMNYIFPPALLGQGDKIDQPTGIGPVMIVLVLFASFYIIAKTSKDTKPWKYFILALLIFTFLGVQGKSLPIAVIPNAHRLWCYLAIPVSILAAEGIFLVAKYMRKYNIRPREVISLLAVGLLITSAYPKFVINTQSAWLPTFRVFSTLEEIKAYTWVKQQPPNTRIFPLCSNYQKVLGYDGYVAFWNQEQRTYQKESLDQSAEEIHSWLKARDYQYAVIDYSCTINWNESLVNDGLSKLVNSGSFELIYAQPQDQPQVFVFKVI